MTTDLEQRLRDALHEDAARGSPGQPGRAAGSDGPPLTVEHHRRRGLRWVAVAAVITLLVFIGSVALLDDDQKVETVPRLSEPLPRTFELVDTAWTFVETSDGPVVSDMVFTADTVSWDTGCARMGASYELDRDDGFLILTNVDTLSGTCGPPTTFGVTQHYPIIDAVMGSPRIPVTFDDGRLYLGEHPDGDYLVLEPLVTSDGGEGAPAALPEPGEQPADPAAAEEQVRNTYLTIADTTIPEEERAQLSERPEVWLAAANAITQTQYWELIQEIRQQVDEVVFVSPTRAVLRFQLISEDPIVPRHHIGEALLVDGRWVMAIATSCDLDSLAGVTCDMTL